MTDYRWLEDRYLYRKDSRNKQSVTGFVGIGSAIGELAVLERVAALWFDEHILYGISLPLPSWELNCSLDN